MYLKVGTILKQIGLKGELKMFCTSSFEETRFKIGNIIYIFNDNNYEELKIKSHKKINGQIHQISFENLSSIEDTNYLLKKDLLIIKDDSVLNENQFYYCDLINCKIISKNESIGIVKNVLDFNGKISLECELNNKKNIYIPFIDVFIETVDIKEKIINVNLIEGMV